jgi:non-haem Fe2+, alpha-ketoglutarate-dependent halogenase
MACAARYMAPHVKQPITAVDGAVLVRGNDRFHNFEDEPRPKADMAPEALASHKFPMDRLSNVVMKGADVSIND